MSDIRIDTAIRIIDSEHYVRVLDWFKDRGFCVNGYYGEQHHEYLGTVGGALMGLDKSDFDYVKVSVIDPPELHGRVAPKEVEMTLEEIERLLGKKIKIIHNTK